MAIQRSTCMDRMWNDFRATFPESDRSSDGWLGDLAHASGTSGHNPDDTPGVTAERTDADTKQEVRAIDKDKDLNSPSGVTLEQVVQRVLITPADRDRLIYIIYKRRIWRKSEGWVQKPYTGGNAHDEHAHFSGDPASDENGSEWKSITSFGANMTNPVEETDPSYNDLIYTVSDISLLNPTITGGPDKDKPNKLALVITSIDSQGKSNGDGIAELKTLVTAGGVTQEMLNTAMAAALADPAVLAALRPVIENAAFTAAQKAEDE